LLERYMISLTRISHPHCLRRRELHDDLVFVGMGYCRKRAVERLDRSPASAARSQVYGIGGIDLYHGRESVGYSQRRPCSYWKARKSSNPTSIGGKRHKTVVNSPMRHAPAHWWTSEYWRSWFSSRGAIVPKNHIPSYSRLQESFQHYRHGLPPYRTNSRWYPSTDATRGLRQLCGVYIVERCQSIIHLEPLIVKESHAADAFHINVISH